MIKQLRVSNFKAFRDQRLPLTPLTLLTGLNGSGKSTVLQALLALRQSFDEGLLQDNRLALDGALVRLGTFQDALFESAAGERIGFEITSDLPGKPVTTKWDFAFGSKDDRVSSEVAGDPTPVASQGIFGPGFRFLSAERIGPRLTYEVADLDLPSVGLGVRGEWAAQYLAANENEPLSIPACQHPNAVAGRLLNQVEGWMSEFSPGLRIEARADHPRDSVTLRYKFEARRGVSNSFRATNVGFGISYTLPVIVAVLASKPGDIILLEAPEAHLHPRGQSRVAQLLARAASGGVQIIAETHSDHVINGVRVAVHEGLIPADSVSFLYFRWDPKVEDGVPTVRTLAMDENGRIDDWPEGFFDEMDQNLEKLLTPKEAFQ